MPSSGSSKPTRKDQSESGDATVERRLNRRFECAVIVSGDSDLLAPVRLVMNELKLPVGVLNPQKRPCRVLANQATFYKHIRAGVLAQSQFPATLTDGRGTFSKPSSW